MKSNPVVLLLLVFAVLFLTGLTIYQNRIIARQSEELRWLLTHCEQRLPAPAPPKK